MATGYIRIVCDDPIVQVLHLRLDAPPKVTGGYGGWEVTKRPRSVAMVEYEGHDPLRMDVALLIDAYATDGVLPDGETVESKLAKIEQLALRDAHLGQPPVVAVKGPVPHADRSWVIENLTWGDTDYNDVEQRSRQQLIVHLLAYEAPTLLVASLGSGRAAKGASAKTYTVRKGDTLRVIAAKQLHDAKRWRDIKRLNHIRAGARLKAGQVLRLP